MALTYKSVHKPILRLVRFVLLLWLVVTAVFLLGRTLPGDPVQSLLGPEIRDPQTVAALRAAYGLDRPLGFQYVRYLALLIQGDFGRSIQTGLPVLSEIAGRVPASFLLGATGFLAGCLFGVSAGTLLAYHHRRPIDTWGTIAIATLNSIPIFIFGLVLLYALGFRLRWFPVVSTSDGRSLVLPGVTLALGVGAYIARLVRVGLLSQSSSQYVLVLHGLGIPPWRIWTRHLLRNAAVPLVTAFGLVLAYCLAGNILLENVFSYPGLGRLLAQSVLARDYPVIQGTVLCIAAIFLTLNLAVEISYGVLDPRLRKHD